MGTLIFRGRVVARDIYNKIVKTPHSTNGRYIIKAFVDFEILDVYKDVNLYQKNNKEDVLTVRVGKCNEGYKLGEEYLIYSEKIPSGLVSDGVKYSDICQVMRGTIYLQEKKILRELSRY